MAVELIKEGNSFNKNIRVYYVDTTAEKNALDTSKMNMGDKIVVLEDGSTYILNSSKEWKSGSSIWIGGSY